MGMGGDIKRAASERGGQWEEKTNIDMVSKMSDGRMVETQTPGRG